MDIRLEEMCESIGKDMKYFTWTIPPEAPEGWGLGNGEQWLKDHPWEP